MQGFLSHPQRQSYVFLSPGCARSMDVRNCKPTENQIRYMFCNYAFYTLTLLDHDRCAYACSGNEGSRLPLPQRKKIFDTYSQGDCMKSFCLYVPYNDVTQAPTFSTNGNTLSLAVVTGPTTSSLFLKIIFCDWLLTLLVRDDG